MTQPARRRALQGLLAASAAGIAGTTGTAQAATAKSAKASGAGGRGIVLQVTSAESARWHAVLGNVRNIRAELGAQAVPIAVVAISAAIEMLTDDSLAANAVQDLQAAGVDFVACGNSMNAQHIGADQLLAKVRVVKAGYVEIHRLQQAGWTYLVP